MGGDLMRPFNLAFWNLLTCSWVEVLTRDLRVFSKKMNDLGSGGAGVTLVIRFSYQGISPLGRGENVALNVSVSRYLSSRHWDFPLFPL